MSGEQFQQWSQGSPLLSLDRFHLKQTPVLNFNYRDSLGFPSYILHKKTFFLQDHPSCMVCIFKCCVTLFFVAQVACFASFQMFASFFFSLPKWLAFHDKKKVCVIVLFCCPCGLFRDLRGSIGFWLEGIGARLGILWDPSRMGSFGGSLFFLGLWEHPKFRGSLFFGTTLE